MKLYLTILLLSLSCAPDPVYLSPTCSNGQETVAYTVSTDGVYWHVMANWEQSLTRAGGQASVYHGERERAVLFAESMVPPMCQSLGFTVETRGRVFDGLFEEEE